MADRQISLSALIRRLEAKRVEDALKLVANGVEYKDYLIGTGKFRENRALIQYLENLIDKDPRPAVKNGNRASDEPDDLDPDDSDDDPDEGEPATPPVARRTKPRAWG